MTKILLSNAGRRSYLVEYLIQLRDATNRQLEIYVSDVSKTAASMMVSGDVKTILTPRVSNNPQEYVEILIQKCEEHGIDIVIPLMDYELPVLARQRERFAEIGTAVVVADPWTIDIAISKEETFSFCSEHRIRTPKTIRGGDTISGLVLPVIMKKTAGSGSVDQVELTRPEMLPETVPDGFVLQEKLTGAEFGMDVLNDMSGQYVHSTVRRKIAMRYGETDQAEVLPDNEFEIYARQISAAFRHRGNMDIDFFVDSSGLPWFIDFNPRFGGGYPFTHQAGVNYLAYILDLISGEIPDEIRPPRRMIGSKGIRLFHSEVVE